MQNRFFKPAVLSTSALICYYASWRLLQGDYGLFVSGVLPVVLTYSTAFCLTPLLKPVEDYYDRFHSERLCHK